MVTFPGEAYGNQGNVQINSSGIRVTGGKLLIEAVNYGQSRVTITNEGIHAGNDNEYVKLTGTVSP